VSSFESALEALRRAGIPFALRRDGTATDPFPTEGELDVTMSQADAARADDPLQAAGFNAFSAPGNEGHRFWLSMDGGRWRKLDAKLKDGSAARKGTLASLRPAGRRRMGPVVAVLGPDGAGKGTLIAALTEGIPVGVRAVYLGMDREPERRSPAGRDRHPERGHRGSRHGSVREILGLGYRVLRAWAMLAPAYGAAWRGHIVLCDRHPIEVLAVRPERTLAGAAFERMTARWLLPWPDAIVVLDAPGATLYARKGEHDVEVLERWRRGYAEAFSDRADVISTAGPEEDARRAASEVVWRALAARRRW
jgi:thymidylate kinase